MISLLEALDQSIEDALDGLVSAWESSVLGPRAYSMRSLTNDLTDDLINDLEKATTLAKAGQKEYVVPIGSPVRLVFKNGKSRELKTTQYNSFSEDDLVSSSTDSLVFKNGSFQIEVPKANVNVDPVRENKMKIQVGTLRKLIKESILLNEVKCVKCGDFNEYAEPNQADGSFVCRDCRERHGIKVAAAQKKEDPAWSADSNPTWTKFYNANKEYQKALDGLKYEFPDMLDTTNQPFEPEVYIRPGSLDGNDGFDELRVIMYDDEEWSCDVPDALANGINADWNPVG